MSYKVIEDTKTMDNGWEPSTKRQDASIIYCSRFGADGHSNEDIATVPTEEIPDCDLLCAFLMGNALVTGVVENTALVLKNRM